jgi:hypothetical protein
MNRTRDAADQTGPAPEDHAAPGSLLPRAGPGARPIPTHPTRARVSLEVGLAIGILLTLMTLRAPGILMHGRFWAEEGRIFTIVRERPLLEQILHLKGGELQILLNIALALAARVPIAYAPLVTTYFGVAATCCLVAFLVRFRRDLRLDLPSALLISVLVLTSSVATENFANTTSVQWTASAVALILILLPGEALRARLRWILPLVILLGLSGVPAASLAPVAALFALARRSRAHGLVATALAGCLVIQAILVMSYGLPPRRTLPTDPFIYVTASFVQLVVKHTLGVQAAVVLGDALQHATVSSRHIWALLVLPCALMVAAALVVLANWRDPLSLALLSTGYIVAFDVFGSLGDPRDMIGAWGMRYFFSPAVIALTALAGRLSAVRLTRCVSASTVVLGIVAAVSTTDFFVHPYFDGFASAEPSWRAELARCPAPPKRCRLAISPPGWFIEMSVPR